MTRRFPWGLASLAVFLIFEATWLVWVHRHDKLIDYYAYDVASAAVAQGASPYRLSQAESQALAQRRGIGPDHIIPPYLYSPFLSALLRPLQALPAPRAAAFWSAGSLLALTLSGCLLSQLRVRRWLDPAVFIGLTLFVPVMTTFYAAQVNHYLLLCMAAATWAIDRGRNRMTGAMLAAGILLKTIPVSIAGVLMLQRRWASLGWLGAFIAGLTLLSLPGVGWSLYAEYLGRAWQLAGAGTAPMVPANQSLGATAFRLLGADTGVPWGRAASAAVVVSTVLMLLWTARQARALLPGVGLVIAGAALAAPLSWIHHQVLLSVPMVILLRECSRTRWEPAAWAVAVSSLVLLGLVGLAWRQLQAWPALQSAGTLAIALLWMALLAVTWRSARPPAPAHRVTATTSADA